MLREFEGKDTAFEKDAMNKYAAEIDICLGDFNQKGKVNHENIAVYKYDFTYFMTPEEIKKLPQEKKPEPLAMPKSFDFNTAERVIITKEELKKREAEEQEKLKI